MAENNYEPKRHILAAWLVGACIYMILAMEVVADAGFLAIPFQFIIGAIFSVVFVGAAMMLGFILRVSTLARFWYSSSVPSVVVLGVALFLIFFGRALGFTTFISIPDSAAAYTTLHPAVAYGSMLAAVFATLHFSRRHDSRTEGRRE